MGDEYFCKSYKGGLIRPAILSDAEDLAPRLRRADRMELKLGLGLEPLRGLRACLSTEGDHYAVEANGQVEMLFGLAPFQDKKVSHCGLPWMTSSNYLHSVSREFLRVSRSIWSHFHQIYPVLSNCIWVKNKAHIRWIQHLDPDVVLIPVPKYGVRKAPFTQFVSRR